MTKRQAIFLIIKIAFAAAALTWLFSKTDVSRVWSNIREADPAPILLGIFLCWITIFTAGWRWHRLLTAAEIPLPLLPLYLIAQIGQFFMVFLPGPAGDDLTRMVYMARLAKGRTARACAIVAIDRIIGLASVLALAAICIPWRWKVLTDSPQTHALALAVLLGGIAIFIGGAFFFLAKSSLLENLLHLLTRFLPRPDLTGKMTAFAVQLHGRRPAIAAVFSVALLTQLLLCAIFYLAGNAVGVDLSLLAWMSFVPIVIASNAIPLTIAGIGVREYLVILFLAVLAGVEAELAIAASLVAFGIMLSMSLLGGLVYIFFRPAPLPEE